VAAVHDSRLHRLSTLQVQALKSELELKTKVLLMPVDACVRHALHGNTVSV
jgi:hypothetical protein